MLEDMFPALDINKVIMTKKAIYKAYRLERKVCKTMPQVMITYENDEYN
jgi:hypothetical protein